ncbi:MAG: S9 family peptidase, partial [Gammaproteobacteria bacterium]
MKLHFPALLLVVAAVAIAFVPDGWAETSPASETARIKQILAQRAKVKHIPAVALSRDGRYLAWIVSHKDKTRLMLASWNGQKARTVKIPGGCKEEGLQWAPNRGELAVLTRCKVDPSNTKPIHGAIWLLGAQAGSAPHKVTDLKGFASGMQWTRDGKRIAFLYVPGATRLPEATASGNPRVGVIGEHDVQVQQVAEVPAAGGTPESLTPAGLYVYDFRLSPNDSQIAYIASPPPGDDNWWSAKLYVQKANADAKPKVIVDPETASGSLRGLQIALPRWSPDASRIFFIGGLMSDRGATGGDIYSVAASGGAPVNMTAGTRVTPSWFEFLSPDRFLVSQFASGKIRVAKYTLSGHVLHQKQRLFSLPGMIGDGSAALALSVVGNKHKRRIAFSESSLEHAPEVHVGRLTNQLAPAVTTVNAGLKKDWGKARSVQWNNDGLRVQGWLIYPTHYDPHKSYPMIVYVHGGPSWMNLPTWGNSAAALSSFGYFVLMPNPR